VGGGCLGIWVWDGRGCLDGGGGRGQNGRGRRCEAVGSRCGRHRWLGGHSAGEGGSAVRSCGHSLGICSNLDDGTTYLEKIPRLYEQKEILIIAIHHACKSLCLCWFLPRTCLKRSCHEKGS